MNIFSKRKPELLFNGDNTQNYINELKRIIPNLNNEGKILIDKDIKFLEIGLFGEKQILFELLNSNIPMYIFHDIYFEWSDLKVQIDFIVVTEYKIFIIECKNIIGNIIINHDGNFIREYNNKKEGMYSPLTQNERHIDLLINLIISRQNKLKQLLFNKTLKNNFESIVVFTNPKTIINKKYAPVSLKSKILRADEINQYIKNIINKCEYKTIDVTSCNKFLLTHSKSNYIDCTKKYEKYFKRKDNENTVTIKEKLKQLRLYLSQKYNVKPFQIFTNSQLDELIMKLPTTLEDLSNINGFGSYKVEKYGQDIINIFNNEKRGNNNV